MYVWPRGNGQVERVNRTHSGANKIVIRQPLIDGIDTLLQMSFNNTYQRSVGMSPLKFFLA